MWVELLDASEELLAVAGLQVEGEWPSPW